MYCPLDNTELKMTERSGIEIDYCPKCRGIWLDRGELDKLLERSRSYEDDYRERRSEGYDPSYRRDEYPYPEKRKRKPDFDIFDIFD